ncbi:MAG: HAMP domain-containing histidine kinase [Nitrospinae bacterium]|nr:HAMP domain-containing histidine kinase [Nitrospinota bacterium]
MLTRLEELLHRHGDALLRRYVARLQGISESYRRRPEYELRQTGKAAFDASISFMLRRTPDPMNRFIDDIVQKRSAAGFKLEEVQEAFQIFRDVVRPVIVGHMPREEINAALELVDECANYSIRRFSGKFQVRQENDMRAVNLMLSAALEDLKRERFNAVAANRLKDQFLANVSHELKTPLTGIIGFSKILMGMEDRDQKTKDKLRVIHEQGRALLRMINTLLLISEINAGGIQISRDAVDFRDLVDLAVQNVKKLKIAENHAIIFTAEEDLPIVICDSEKMMEVVFELLLNSLKFSEPGAGVNLRLRRNGGQMALEVIDEGVGIDAEEFNRIFSPFYQLDGSITRKYGGNGLGLTMIKKVVELHNGSISVASNPGKGSTFTVVIPLVQTPA